MGIYGIWESPSRLIPAVDGSKEHTTKFLEFLE